MTALPQLNSVSDLANALEEFGFLPLFHNPVSGFSVEDMTPSCIWWDGSPGDPWQWRKEIAHGRKIAYGKFFCKKAGFISARWLPYFTNARRDGYDFDALYDDGKATIEQKRIMDCFADGRAEIPAHMLKTEAGLHSPESGSFDSAVAQLQMQTYLVICDFVYKHNRAGLPYGWPVSEYAMPETVFGADLVKGRYFEKPAASYDAILSHAARILPQCGEKALRRLIH